MTVRKPRKMPKNQRAYPKKGKPRLVEITDHHELAELYEHRNDLGAPQVYFSPGNDKIWGNGCWIEAGALKKWRALRNPPTSTGDA